MFRLSPDDRISAWASLRAQLEDCEDPFQKVQDFWKAAPYVPYNHHVDRYNQTSWPTPWEIIVENRYDDFTKALMMAYSLKFTNRFKNSVIQIRSLLDSSTRQCYNIICVDEEWVLNYSDDHPVAIDSISNSFSIENIMDV